MEIGMIIQSAPVVKTLLSCLTVSCVFPFSAFAQNVPFPFDKHSILPSVTSLALPTPCNGQTPCFLTLPTTISETEAENYLNVIGARTDTWAKFIERNGFATGGSDHATYFNNGDLQFGRDMYCRTNPGNKPNQEKVACYVANYGQPPFIAGVGGAPGAANPLWVTQSPSQAISDALTGAATRNPTPFAVVAMEYSPTPAPLPVITQVHEYDGVTSALNPSSCLGSHVDGPPDQC
jgi:hypothetical protein